MACHPWGCAAAVTAPRYQGLHLGFQPQNPKPKLAPKRNPPSRFTFSLSRFNSTAEFERRLRLFGLFASNANPSGGDSITDKSDATKSRDTAQGPPFLTI